MRLIVKFALSKVLFGDAKIYYKMGSRRCQN